MRHVLSGGRGRFLIVVFRGRCVQGLLPGLVQGWRLCIGCGVGESAVREDVGSFGAELEDDAPFRLLLQGPLVEFALWPVVDDVVAPSPVVDGEEAEDGVLSRVLYVLHVHRHVCDVDGVLLIPFLCGGAWRGNGHVPVESLPCVVRQVALEACPVLGGALASLPGGMVAPWGVRKVCPWCPLSGWGPRVGALRGAGAVGVCGVVCHPLGPRRCLVRCRSVSSVCWSSSPSNLSMSRAIGPSLVVV